MAFLSLLTGNVHAQLEKALANASGLQATQTKSLIEKEAIKAHQVMTKYIQEHPNMKLPPTTSLTPLSPDAVQRDPLTAAIASGVQSAIITANTTRAARARGGSLPLLHDLIASSIHHNPALAANLIPGTRHQ